MYALNTETDDQQVAKPRCNVNSADYQQCHPYIYLWMKTILTPLSRGTFHVDDYRLYRAFKTHSFKHELVKNSLSSFIRTHAQIIQSWSIHTLSTPCSPIKLADITEAITISLR